MNLKFSKELNKSEMDDSQESSGSDCDGKVRDAESREGSGNSTHQRQHLREYNARVRVCVG